MHHPSVYAKKLTGKESPKNIYSKHGRGGYEFMAQTSKLEDLQRVNIIFS